MAECEGVVLAVDKSSKSRHNRIFDLPPFPGKSFPGSACDMSWLLTTVFMISES